MICLKKKQLIANMKENRLIELDYKISKMKDRLVFSYMFNTAWNKDAIKKLETELEDLEDKRRRLIKI